MDLSSYLVVFMILVVGCARGKVDLYLSTEQTEALYGIKTEGLYYVKNGRINQYAMTFQHQVIPAKVDHIDFTWQADTGEAIPYKMTFIHTPGPAMDAPSVNVSMAGLVPTYKDKFRLMFPCTGKVDAEVDTLLQVSLDLEGNRDPKVLNFKRRKICKETRAPAEGLVSDLATQAPAPTHRSSILLASVSPTVFIGMGAASASILLIVLLLAVLYVKRMRKRGHQLENEAGSLRSSMHLHSELEYTEKLQPPDFMEVVKPGGLRSNNVNITNCDSFATLASFTQVPINRAETPGWARYSSPSVADYSNPLTKSPPPLPRPSPSLARMGMATSSSAQRTAGSLLPGQQQLASSSRSSSSIHSTSLVYDTAKSRVATHFTPIRSVTAAANRSRVAAGFDVPVNMGGSVRPPPSFSSYPDYEYTTPGEASPYSVSSELYKHVLPQYYKYGGGGGSTDGNKSVLV